MARAQVSVGRQGLTGGMPGAGCVTDVLIRTVCTGMRGSACAAGASGRQGLVRWTRAVAEESGQGILPGKWLGETVGEDRRKR